MRPLIVLSAVFAFARAAPSNYGVDNLIAPVIAPVVAPAPVVSVPAPYSTQEVQGEAIVSVHQPPAQITKQLHFATRPYVAGYDTTILKPQIPDFRIAVPTALRGTVAYNAPIVKVAKETHVVNEPFPVDKPFDVPYDVIKNVVQTVEVPTPVHVDKPYAVPHPVPVAGEPIIQRVQGAPIVHHSHETILAEPIASHSYAGAYPIAPHGIAHHY